MSRNVEPLYPEPVERIKAKYAAKIKAQTNETLKMALQVECNGEVAREIARQRAEAMERGGELGARLKAEQEAAKVELDAEMAKLDPRVLEEARKWQEQAERILNAADPAPAATTCPYCDSPVNGSRFCPNCGAKQER